MMQQIRSDDNHVPSYTYLYRCKNGGYIVGGAPSVLQNVQTDAPVSVDVRVEHGTLEAYSWWSGWIVFVKQQAKLKDAILVKGFRGTIIRNMYVCIRIDLRLTD